MTRLLIPILLLLLSPVMAQQSIVQLPPRKVIVIPPSPLQSKNWTTTFRSFAQSVTPEGTPLVLVGDYSGPVQARYELRVFESTDLRNWSQAATLPVSTSWAYMVDRKVSAFFHVKAWDTLENKELQGAVSKVVMDP